MSTQLRRNLLESTRVIKLNCNEVKTPKDIYIKLARRLLPAAQSIGRVEELQLKLTEVMKTSKDMMWVNNVFLEIKDKDMWFIATWSCWNVSSFVDNRVILVFCAAY